MGGFQQLGIRSGGGGVSENDRILGLSGNPQMANGSSSVEMEACMSPSTKQCP